MRTYAEYKAEKYLSHGVRCVKRYTVPNDDPIGGVGVLRFSATVQSAIPEDLVTRTENAYFLEFDENFEMFGIEFRRKNVDMNPATMKAPETDEYEYNSAMFVTLHNDRLGTIGKDLHLASNFVQMTRDQYMLSRGPTYYGAGMEHYSVVASGRGAAMPVSAPTTSTDPVFRSVNEFKDPEGRGITFLEKELLKITCIKQRMDPRYLYADRTDFLQCVVYGRML